MEHTADNERRVLALAPTSKDAELIGSLLSGVDIACVCCPTLESLCDELEAGTGALLLAEEALLYDHENRLARWLAQQPSWSDLPVLLLARHGADSTIVAQAMELLGNVTVLERPMRLAALVSAVFTALRARRRQYELRDQLAELRQTEQALRQSQAAELARRIDYETLVQVAPAAIWVAHDPECRVITGNPAAARMLHTTTSTNVSLNSQEIQPPYIVETFIDGQTVRADELPMQQAARTGQPVPNRELEFRFDDGSVTWAYGNAAPLFDTDGRVRGVVGTFIDITERKLAEQALRDADRRKDEFLAILAHELRNPLAPIRNSLHILRLTAQDDSTVHRIGEMMDRQVDHMVRLVDDLLEVSRISRGDIELQKERVDLASIVQSAVETSRPLIEASRHRLSVSVANGALPVHADPMRLSQVFSNLLNNAAKYTKDGGDIALSVERVDNHAFVRIRDNGVGIPREMLPRIFEPFTQVDRSASRAKGGLGIGLTLADRLVRMHGGSIEASSDGPGHGSEFTVQLPLSASTHGTHRRAPAKPAAAKIKLSCRVLVVDDSRDAANSLAMLLRLTGAEVCVAYGGTEGVEACEQFMPSVVLLDIGMPGMDGFEVARRIRQLPEAGQITLIALTGWGQTDDRRRTRLAGFDHHLVKPVDIHELLDLLATFGQRPAPRGKPSAAQPASSD